VLEQSKVVAPGETIDFQLDIPVREGPCQLVLGTEMSPDATTNGFAWARWTRPCLR